MNDCLPKSINRKRKKPVDPGNLVLIIDFYLIIDFNFLYKDLFKSLTISNIEICALKQ